MKKKLRWFGLVVMIILSVSAFAEEVEKLDKIAALVNDNVITERELMAQLDVVRKQLDNKKMQRPPEDVLRRQVLNHMIDVDLQLQIAKNNNVVVDKESVTNAIEGIAKKNHISMAALKKSITSQGIPFEQYRDNIKKEMLLSRFQQQVVGSIFVDKSEVDDYLKSNKHKQHLKFHVKDIVLRLPEAPSPKQLIAAKENARSLIKELRSGLGFSDAALAKSSGQFALDGGDLGYRTLAGLPKMFVSRVVKMKNGDIEGPIRAPNGFHIIKLIDVKGHAAKQMVSLTRVRHILITEKPGMSSAEAHSKIKNIYKQIKKGKSFETMAKRYSVDNKSASKGGLLGWLHDGETVPMFELVMNKLKPGQVSEPVHTSVGWHLIKVDRRKVIDDSKVYQRQLVRQQLYQRKFLAAVQNYLQQLRANSYIKLM